MSHYREMEMERARREWIKCQERNARISCAIIAVLAALTLAAFFMWIGAERQLRRATDAANAAHAEYVIRHGAPVV